MYSRQTAQRNSDRLLGAEDGVLGDAAKADLVRATKNLFGVYDKKLILHIGQPKTGTTSIQRFCLNHRDHLLRQGVLYPDAGRHGPGQQHFAPRFLVSYGYKLPNHPYSVESFKNSCTALAREIDKYNDRIDTILISSEELSALPSSAVVFLSDIFSDVFDVSILLYLRRQDAMIESMCAQDRLTRRVNSPFYPESLSTGHGLLDLQQQTSHWHNTFRCKSFHIEIYERNSQVSSLEEEFLASIGLSPPHQREEKKRLNKKLSRAASEYLYTHSNVVYESQQYFDLVAKLDRYSRLSPTPPEYRYYHAPETRIKLLNEKRESNQNIAVKYFNRRELFNDPWPQPTEPWVEYPGLSVTDKSDIELFLRTE